MPHSDVPGTALGPMFVLAVEQYTPASQRVVDDPLVASLLPRSMRVMNRLMAWAPLRRWMIRTSEADAAGLWGNLLCRKAYARAEVRRAVADGIDQLVVLGAGMDTLASLVASPANVPAWELDLPINIEAKRAGYVRALGGVPDNIRLVPADFETEDVGQVLARAGFRLDLPALFVMEAVSQYITDAAMRGLLGFLAGSATGSRLSFTYVQKDFVDGTRDMGAASLRRRFVEKQPPLWTYALDPSDVGTLLADYRWTQREDLDPDEYRRRFIAPTGRELVVSDVEHYVGADKV